MTDKEFDWREHFALCTSGEDFVALYMKVQRNRNSRKAYLNHLKKQGDKFAIDAVKEFKERRHDRRKGLRERTLQLNLKLKETKVDVK